MRRPVCRLTCCSLSLVLGLSACTLPQRMREALHDYRQADRLLTRHHVDFTQSLTDDEKRQAQQRVDKPWVVGKPQPLARELGLPEALRARVRTTLLFADGTDDLRQIARRLTAVTGIPVRVRPDALLPYGYFLPRLSGQAAQSAPPPALPQELMLADGPAALPDILDRLCAHLGVRWRHDAGGIEFFRTETRVFNVRALTLEARAQASLGLDKGQNEGGFVSTSSTRLSGAEQDVLKTVRARIEPFLSRAGILAAEPGAGATIVVTDTPDVLERIAHYLDQENRALTRRVRLVFEELTVALNEQAQAGLDWNLVFASAGLVAGISVPGLSSVATGQLGLGLTRGPFTGSEAVIRALGESVKLVRRSSVPMLTLNRRPVTHAVRTTFSYIDRVGP